MDTVAGRGPTVEEHAACSRGGAPRDRVSVEEGTGGESEGELGPAGHGEVPGFRSWRSGEVQMVLSSRVIRADFPCNRPLWLLSGARL